MISKYHTHPESQDSARPAPAGYHARKLARSKLLRVDHAAIAAAEGRGSLLLAQAKGGGSGPACFNCHNLTQSTLEEKEQHRFKNNYRTIRPALTLSTGGSAESASGEISSMYFWGMSAKVSRSIRQPKSKDKTHRAPDYEEKQISGILAFQEARPYLKQLTVAEIQKTLTTSNRGEIDAFSNKSRARLKFTASNAFPHLVSMFVCTYGDSVVPTDGRVAKKHLHRFLMCIRRKFPLASYLWLLEFNTKRNCPHFHIFLSFPAKKEIRLWLAKTWVRVVGAEGEEKKKMLSVHEHSLSFIDWNMGKAGYLTKYLEKSSQKNVPQGFQKVGRFWGSTRSIVPPPAVIQPGTEFNEYTCTDKITGETFTTNSWKNLYRILRKHTESQYRTIAASKKKKGKPPGPRKKSRLLCRGMGNVNISSGGLLFHQYCDWLARKVNESIPLTDIPF